MSDVMLCGVLRMPISQDCDPMMFEQFVDRARQAADELEKRADVIESLTADVLAGLRREEAFAEQAEQMTAEIERLTAERAALVLSWNRELSARLEIENERDAANASYELVDKMMHKFGAERDALRATCQWYSDEARALARNLHRGAHSPAVLASVTVLAIDGGKRFDAAMNQSTERKPNEADPRNPDRRIHGDRGHS
jgi:hypothetical protein